jgi:glycosyltransferase involved in cell wall biosynthesis
MRILLAHTYYKQPGGEDRVFEAECALLRRNGHDVVEYRRHNDQTDTMSRSQLAAGTLWSRSTYSELRKLLQRERPDICHFHNTFPVMSPSAFWAAHEEGVPVVVTLHNYRLLCPSATLMRRGAVCEDCLSKMAPWPAVRHACYRDSRAASAVTALMLTAHRAMGTWSRAVNVWIALTEFARDKFVEGGVPADRIEVKGNFVHPDPGEGGQREQFAFFAGRLSPEKGIDTLLSAWRRLEVPLPLRIAGDGPLRERVEDAVRRDSRIEYLGAMPGAEVQREMKRASLLVFPSIWYEGLPLTIVEAYAAGLPVLAGRLGAMSGLVASGETGLHFIPGDGADLAAKLSWCYQNPDSLAEMGRRARLRYLANYTADSNYRRLMEIYGAITPLGHQLDRTNRTAVIDQVAAAESPAGWGAAGSRS